MTGGGIPSYRRTARTDYRIWLMLVFGIAFFWAGSTTDPATNCSEDGRECAPWLVPIGQGLGALLGLGATLFILANPGRGSFTDPATGDLVWWQGRIGATGGKEGRIHPSRIGRIRIVRRESDDSVSLYDLDGEPLAWFNQEVLPSPSEHWAEKLKAQWPHIAIEIAD